MSSLPDTSALMDNSTSRLMGGNGFSALSHHHYLPHGRLREDSLRTNDPQAAVLVSLCWWQFCHLATRTGEVGEVPWQSEWHSQEYLFQLGGRERRPPFPGIEIHRRLDGSLVHKALLSILHKSAHSHMARLPIIKLFFDLFFISSISLSSPFYFHFYFYLI